MAEYSIKDLERISGIKAHTLRIWEKRYGLLKPKRTATNIRYYLNDDLQHLLKVVYLNQHGVKISKIAQLTQEELVAKVEDMMQVKEGLDGENDALVLSVLQLDRYKVERILNHKMAELGFEQCLFTVIYPLLEKINLLWIADSFEQYHEKFLIQIIKQKIIKQIDELSQPSGPNLPRVLLFSNKPQDQDLALLLADYYLRKYNYNSINLGAPITEIELSSIKKGYGEPDVILLMINSSSSQDSVRSYLATMEREFPSTKLWVSGYMFFESDLGERISILTDVTHLQELAKTVHNSAEEN